MDARLRLAAGILGLGLAGFFDGVLFHQLLRWHHVNSAWASDPAALVRADGIFHAATFGIVVLGVALLARALLRTTEPRPGRAATGAALVGWGAFHLLDSVVFHWLLGMHHIWPEGPGGWLAWDLLYLAAGVAIAAAGWALGREPRPRAARGRRAAV